MRGIAASFVIPGDGETPPIVGGAVVLDGAGRVLAVGEEPALRAQHPGAGWERHDAVLTPGLVNAHTHLELSAVAGQVPGGKGFVPWLEALVAVRARLSPERDGESIDAAVSSLLASGTVAVGEVTNTLASVEALASAPLVARVFHEIFGVPEARLRARLEEARAQREALTRWPENLSYALAPHTPYTLQAEALVQLVATARMGDELTSLHLCEHTAERKFLADGGGPFAGFLQSRGLDPTDLTPPGRDPVRYAASLGVLAPDVLAVHLADARPDELEAVAEAGAPVVVCPRSNLHIQVKLPPLPAMLQVGLRPGLGTDSLASCPSLDVLEDARALAARFHAVPARTLLAMATGWGADALRLGDRFGRLAPGKTPGVLAFEHAPGAPPVDPEAFVLSRAPVSRKVLSRPPAMLAPSEASP